MRHPKLFARSFLLVLSFAPALAAQSYRLNELPRPSAVVSDFRVTPDGRRVVYLARPGPEPALHPYVVDVQKPGERRLLDARNCGPIELADGRRLVYGWTDGTTFGVSSILIDGDEPAIELGPGTGAKPTPDGRTVVLQRPAGLFRVPADGSRPAELIHSSSPSPIHFQWVLTPDSQRVLYVTEGSIQFAAGYGHLYSAPLDGSSAPVALNTAAVPAAVQSFVVSPDSRWVVFRRMSRQGGVGLYRAPIDGSAPAARLHDPLPAGAEVESFTAIHAPRFTPDASRVVYRLDQEVADLEELYSAPLDGSTTPQKLSDAANPYVFVHRISADGSRVVFTAGQDALPEPLDLFWVPIDGGISPQKLNGPLVPGRSVLEFAIGPDSRRVAYFAQQEPIGRLDLFSVSMTGAPAPVQLNAPDEFGYSAHFDGLAFAYQGNFIVYLAAPRGVPLSRPELFVAQAEGLGHSRPLSGPMVAGGQVISLNPFVTETFGDPTVRLAANGTLALFRADKEKNNVFELWAAPILAPRRR